MQNRDCLILAGQGDHALVIHRDARDGTQVGGGDQIVAPIEGRGASGLRNFEWSQFRRCVGFSLGVFGAYGLCRRWRKLSDEDGARLEPTKEVTAAVRNGDGCDLAAASELDCRGTNFE